jgi:hypothetical protein
MDGKWSKKTRFFGLALSLPHTGRIVSATSAMAEKPVHDGDSLGKILAKRSTDNRNTPICQIEETNHNHSRNGDAGPGNGLAGQDPPGTIILHPPN